MTINNDPLAYICDSFDICYEVFEGKKLYYLKQKV